MPRERGPHILRQRDRVRLTRRAIEHDLRRKERQLELEQKTRDLATTTRYVAEKHGDPHANQKLDRYAIGKREHTAISGHSLIDDGYVIDTWVKAVRRYVDDWPSLYYHYDFTESYRYVRVQKGKDVLFNARLEHNGLPLRLFDQPDFVYKPGPWEDKIRELESRPRSAKKKTKVA